jgi:hypothetical protein
MTAACSLSRILNTIVGGLRMLPQAVDQSMKFAAEYMLSPLQLMLVTHSSMLPLTVAVSDPE